MKVTEKNYECLYDAYTDWISMYPLRNIDEVIAFNNCCNEITKNYNDDAEYNMTAIVVDYGFGRCFVADVDVDECSTLYAILKICVDKGDVHVTYITD